MIVQAVDIQPSVKPKCVEAEVEPRMGFRGPSGIGRAHPGECLLVMLQRKRAGFVVYVQERRGGGFIGVSPELGVSEVVVAGVDVGYKDDAWLDEVFPYMESELGRKGWEAGEGAVVAVVGGSIAAIVDNMQDQVVLVVSPRVQSAVPGLRSCHDGRGG
jgi:hypothetical protein